MWTFLEDADHTHRVQAALIRIAHLVYIYQRLMMNDASKGRGWNTEAIGSRGVLQNESILPVSWTSCEGRDIHKICRDTKVELTVLVSSEY